MNRSEKVFFDELMERVSVIEESRNLRETKNGTCSYGRGGCCVSFGMPGKSGNDGLVCKLGNPIDKPNKWCWSCWRQYKIERLTEALKWCSKAADFHEGGKAYEGWKSAVQHHVGAGIDSFSQWSNSGSNYISASEALFGFVGWLTSRDQAVTFSGHHNAGVAADLVALFCEVNDLAEPRDHWEKNLVHPKECRPDGESTVTGEVAEEGPSSWQFCLEQVLSKLSGDLSHDNVAAAKQIILKALINEGNSRVSRSCVETTGGIIPDDWNADKHVISR